MTTTPKLIDALVECATPVRRLRPPVLRAAAWLALAAVILALLAIGHGLRPDLAVRLHQPDFAVSIAAAAATGILAAVAAFILSLPDRSRWWLALPLPSLAVWVTTIGYGCFTDWVTIGPDGVSAGETLRCFATLLLVGVPLSIALAVMLRYVALMRPRAVTLAGALAVAAVTSTALTLMHDIDATAMILVWNLGVAALITGIGSLFGDRMLAWAASRVPAARPQERRGG